MTSVKSNPDGSTKPRIGRPPKLDASGVPTRERLLAAGAKAFAEAGFEATTLVDIARRAEISAPAIYNHFADKEEVFVEVARWALAEMRSDDTPFSGDLHATVERYLAPQFADVRRLLLEIHLASFRHERVAELLHAWHAENADRTEDLGVLDRPSIKMVYLILLGCAQLDALAGLGVSHDDLVARAHRVVDALLAD